MLLSKAAGVLPIHRELHTPPIPSHFLFRRKQRPRKPRESRKSKRDRLARLETMPVPQLFLSSPPTASPSLFRPKGYTGCRVGYWRSSRQRLKTILRNSRILGRRFTHLCNINLLAPRHPELINRDFKEFLKKLSKEGVSGHWTIEIDRSNIVHWHLLFQNYGGDEDSLKATVTRCLKSVSTFPRFRVYADRIRNQRRKLEYVLKVKKTGYGEVFDPLKEENHGKISGTC